MKVRPRGPSFRRARLIGFGVLLLAASCPVRPARATPRGEMRAWIEEGYARWGPYGIATTWDGPVSHSDGAFYPENRGIWNFWIDAAPRHQEFRLTGREVPGQIGRLSFLAGDTEADRDSLTTLQQEYRPAVLFRGGALGLRRESFQAEVYGGALTRNQTPFRGGRAPAGAGVGGLSLAGRLARLGSWQATWDRQGDLPDIPGRHLLRLAASTRAGRGWTRTTEARLSREDGDPRWRSSLLAGGEFLNARFQAAGHLRRIENGFGDVGLYQDPHTNEWGGRLQGNFRPAPTSFAGGSIDWSRDLDPRAPLPSREERFVGRGYFTTTLRETFYLQTMLLYRSRSSVDPDSVLIDQGVSSGGAEVGWKIPSADAGLGFNRGLFRDESLAESAWREDRWTAHVARRFGQQFDTRLSSFVTERRLANGDWKSRETSLEARVSWSSTSLQNRGWLSVGRDRQSADVRQYERDQWNLGAGCDLALPRDLSLRADGFVAFRAGQAEAEAARFTLRVSRHFSFGGGRLAPRETLPEFGTIQGYVRDDRNGNGTADADEPGIPGIHLSLGDGTPVTTASDGSYVFPRATAGTASVRLDVSRLPASYLAPAEERLSLSITPGENAFRSFALARAASVSGQVILVNDEGDSLAVAGVLVHIPGTQQDAFTDGAGRFELTDLTAGMIRLEIAEWSLPPETRMSNGKTRDIRLTAGVEASAVPFILRPYRAPVLQIFRPK